MVKVYEVPPRSIPCPDCPAGRNEPCREKLTGADVWIWVNLPKWHPGREALAGVKEAPE